MCNFNSKMFTDRLFMKPIRIYRKKRKKNETKLIKWLFQNGDDFFFEQLIVGCY